MSNPAAPADARSFSRLGPMILVSACLVWAFGSTLAGLAQVWNTNQSYSHGFLVPVFAGFLLWMRRDQLDASQLRPSLWGFALLAFGLALRLAGTYWYFISLDPISFIPCVGGVVLLLGGKAGWKWAWPAVLFLSFMIPLPYRVAEALSGPLQRAATVASTYVMQTMGLPALAEGNTIQLNDHSIGIVEACSGLRMLVVFFALSTAVVLVSKRHWLDNVLIIASAVPIALLSNLVRVTATGVMFQAGWSEAANHFFHDAAGWVMMPLALCMLWVELKLLDNLFLDAPAQARPASNPARRASMSRVPPRRQRTAKPAPAPAPVEEPAATGKA